MSKTSYFTWYPVRCAPNPPPCLLCSLVFGLLSCFSRCFFEDLWKEECKKQAVCSRIFEFGRSIFGHFGYPRGSFSVILEAPGAHFGGLGAHLDPLGPNLRILIKNGSKSEFADPPRGSPNRPKLDQIWLRGGLEAQK